MTLNNVVRIMIVDDHPMVRKGLVSFVNDNKELMLVGEAENAKEALLVYEQCNPDVILLDMILPDASGASVIRKIRQKNPNIAIIALTAYGHENIIEDALQAGVKGFLHKYIELDDLMKAILQAYKGFTTLDGEASKVMMRMVNSSTTHSGSPSGIELSEREYDVLRLLAQGMTNKQIAAHLGLQSSTVKQYISNIFSKLGVQSRTEAVAYALKLGLFIQ